MARNFGNKDILPLYKFRVSLHLKYDVCFLFLHLKKYIDNTEKLKQRTTKLIPSFRNKPYKN